MQIKHQLFILSATLLTCFLSILVICVLVLSTKIDNSFDDDSNNQPICAKGTLFDRKTMQKCQLQHYTTEDVANCFNELYSQPQRRYKPVHIAFVGDSIIRNQFINFIRLIPDYDLETKMSTISQPFHWQEDRIVTSNLLHLRLSFHWRTLVDEELTGLFSKWLNPLYSSSNPDFIVTGMVAWHLNYPHEIGYKKFINGLQEVKLTTITRVVWLLQAPGPSWPQPIFSIRIPNYLNTARDILKESGVEFWYSGDPIGMEYTRACIELNRNNTIQMPTYRCLDPLHHGTVVLEHSSQTLINEICNCQLQTKEY